MPLRAHVLGGMDSVSDMNTRQINVMSNQLFEQTTRIAELHSQMTLLGSQLQQTQLHISAVDARVPSFVTITNVLKTLVAKINEVILRTRGPSPEEERILLDDLQAINMELAMGDLVIEQPPRNCACDYNSLCDKCF
jgi:septal ring factor EnvC (AmiA/AmiB activator)